MQTSRLQFDKNQDREPTISQRQLLVMLVSAILLALLLSAIYFQERSKESRLRIEQCSHRLALAQEIIVRDLNRVRSDLLFVAALPEVQSANSIAPESLHDATNIFQHFVKSQNAYSQIRLIDRQGMEIARVDWNNNEATVTQRDNLQDKSDRYYVDDSLALDVGQIFTSEFDLNLEQGKIELPVKPVIRFVTPVLQNGTAGYLLVFNYQGMPLLRELSEMTLPGQTFLIRKDGEFLLGPTTDSEWGWLLQHSHRFSTSFPTVNLDQLLKPNSAERTSEGFFQTKNINFDLDKTASNLRQSLFLVAHVPIKEAFQNSSNVLNWLLTVGGIMLIPLALITRFWASSVDRRRYQNKKIAQSEKRLRQLSAQLVSLQEEERRSLSREIHDSLGQQATAINLDLRMLKEKSNHPKELIRVIQESDKLLQALHSFATRARPAELDDLGLQEALESHIWNFEKRTGIDCEFDCQFINEEIDPAISVHVFRIIQESLNNISKHAKADVAAIQLALTENKDELQVTVTDDGVGLGSESTNNEHGTEMEKRLGMLGMRERVELLNGKLHLENSADGGTKLKIQIPVFSLKTDAGELE